MNYIKNARSVCNIPGHVGAVYQLHSSVKMKNKIEALKHIGPGSSTLRKDLVEHSEKTLVHGRRQTATRNAGLRKQLKHKARAIKLHEEREKNEQCSTEVNETLWHEM